LWLNENMDNKRRIYRIIETYLNKIKKDVVEEFYGKNSRIKITNITFTVKNNSIVIESTVILGDIITEEILDTSLAEILIQDIIQYIHPNSNVRITISWDS
jgi:hypothetical protein